MEQLWRYSLCNRSAMRWSLYKSKQTDIRSCLHFEQKNSGCYPCRHTEQTIWYSLIPYGLAGCLCCVWSTSHVPGRFPDLQIIACFTFSHIWVMQWFSKLAPWIQWPVRSGLAPDSLFRKCLINWIEKKTIFCTWYCNIQLHFFSI